MNKKRERIKGRDIELTHSLAGAGGPAGRA
jgi:hypothetical protein